MRLPEIVSRHERVDREGCYHETENGELPIVVEHERAVAEEREGLHEQVAHSTRDRLLDLLDVVRDVADERSRRLALEETHRLPDDVLVEDVPEVHDRPLPHPAHEIGREVRKYPLGDIDHDDEHGDLRQVLVLDQDVVENRLDEIGEPTRGRTEAQHRNTSQ